MRRAIFGLLAASLSLSAAPAYAGAGVDEARKAIVATNAKYGEAVAKGDAAAIVKMYTKDAIVLPADQPIVMKSPAGIEALWKASFQAGVKAMKLETLDVERRGDTAIETGKYSMTIQPGGKPAGDVHGKYVVVWRKDGDTWKLHRDIWNADPVKK